MNDLKEAAELARDVASKIHPKATVIVMIARGPTDGGFHYVAHSGGTEEQLMKTHEICTARLKEAIAEAKEEP